ncbi:hypothetical protein E1B28_006627 [Marasmius oreades]|uniref:Large ribosomal subunit protein bL28c n=1 Tax=Marasmius oreades TaxID=181124 RepID=A0A9P7UWJ2_9AGAR|nr:uncharacterized protein E1B28_006627 [Marasmius oreades]KAG7095943.1 hypothetical protein E1B28_006627 [Marasmius oreades]
MFVTLPTLKVAPVSQPFKRAQLGLFQGKSKRYGNNVPFSKHKTRRTWLPNVQRKRLPSEALGKDIRVKLTTRALKTIKKHGGIDNYLLQTRHETLGCEGLRLRLVVREAQKNPPPPPRETAEERTLREENELLVRRTEKAVSDRASELRNVVEKKKPTLETASAAREQALKALGGSASPGSIIDYLRKQKKEQKSLLGSAFANMSIS